MARAAKVIPLRRLGKREAEPAAFDLEVTLRDIQPPIWRRLRVASSLTLRELHHVLQIAFGWNDSHLHEFEIGARRFGMPDPQEDIGESPLDEREVRLAALLEKGARFEYTYDFGDGWRHLIVVEDVAGQGAVKAECLDGARSGPPDDCGGPGGYEQLLEALAHPKRKGSRDLLEWVGKDFDPALFDIRSINHDLRTAGTAAFLRRRETFYEGR